MQTKLSKQHFYLVRKWVAPAQARKGKCLWAQCEMYWESKTHETQNLPTLVCSGPWKHLHSLVLAEILSPASSSEPVVPLSMYFAFMASASPRPDGCSPQSHCGKGWVLAFTTPYKSYCWEWPNIIPNKRLSFILLYLPIVHARYHEGVTAFAGVKKILGPYRDCSYSACFPGQNKSFTHDQLHINFFPWWECSSCVHKTAIRDRQLLFLPLQPTAWKAGRNLKRSLPPASCPKAVLAVFLRGPYLKAEYSKGKPSNLCFFKCQA